MSKYIDAERLLAEIERQSKSIENATGDFAEGRRWELDNLHKLIASLQQEQPEVDLKKELKNLLKSSDNGCSALDVARHFAEWGTIHLNARKEE